MSSFVSARSTSPNAKVPPLYTLKSRDGEAFESSVPRSPVLALRFSRAEPLETSR